MRPDLHSLLDKKDIALLFVGIGNVLLSDDGTGVYISQRLKEDNNIKVITVEVSIENYIKKINDTRADIIILIDCVSFNKEPGYYSLISATELIDFTTNTHNISLKNISAFFKKEVFILGIQPANVTFGEKLTDQVKRAADEIIELINNR